MNETVKDLISRKSCKCYQDRHVDRELIDQIVAAGLNAPTGRNMQTPRFVVVTNDDTVSKLSAYKIFYCFIHDGFSYDNSFAL